MTLRTTRLPRRTLATLAASALSSCGNGQNTAVAQSFRSLTGGGGSAAMPCANRPGDIVGLVLEGTGAPAGTVVVFGQAFRQGAVRRGGGLQARQAADGAPLQAQLDAKAHHPDGSVRFGVVSLATPALRAGEKRGVLLASGPGGGAGALNFATALAGRQAALELQAPNSQALRVDLLARLRADRTARPWQSGPLVSETRISLPIPPAALGGVSSMRLVADIAARADGTLWVDAWLRNDAAMQPGGGPATYSMQVLLDGKPALRAEGLKHNQYTGWGRHLRSAPGGVPAPVPPLVRPDVSYLAETGAVHRYDLSIGVADGILAGMGQAVADPGWATPLGTRGITTYMPMTGGRADIGPTTSWQAAWLLSGDPRAAAFCQGQAEGAGSVPWHMWDPNGGADGKGGWLDTKRWPRFWTDPRGGAPPKTLLQGQPYGDPFTPDSAHQPDLCYVPFLLTGRRALLDGLQAQAVYSIIGTWPDVRTDSDVVIVQRRQVRGAAWSLRQIDEAAWISPDDDSNADYLRFAAKENWSWLVARIPEWTALQGEAHGWLEPGEYNYDGGFAPWQQDFFASTVIASASRGNRDAVTYLNWASNWLVGRFLSDNKGLNYRDGIAYAMPAVEGPNDRRLKTWAEIGKLQVARNQSNSDKWSNADAGYVMAGIATLAGIISLGGPPAKEARRAYDRLLANAGRGADPGVMVGFPTFNIVPRGGYRNPSNAPACSAPA
jgi:hypothetical protein